MTVSQSHGWLDGVQEAVWRVDETSLLILHANAAAQRLVVSSLRAARSGELWVGLARGGGVAVLRDTIEFGSSATNLEQPLWVPQALWVAGLGLLALISLVYALHAVYLLVRRRPELNAWYGLHGAQDELDAELANIQARGVTSVTPPSSRTN